MKKVSSQSIIIAVLGIGIIVAGIFAWQQYTRLTKLANSTTTTNTLTATVDQPLATAPQEPAAEQSKVGPNPFDPLQYKVRDSIAGMKIVAVQPALDGSPLNQYNVRVAFSGQATVSGAYEYQFTELIDEYLACFTVDAADASKIPQFIQFGGHPPYFCFFNTDKTRAEQLLGKTNHRATITIEDLELVYAPEALSQAGLVAVVK